MHVYKYIYYFKKYNLLKGTLLCPSGVKRTQFFYCGGVSFGLDT